MSASLSRLLEAVAEHGSLEKAAEALGVELEIARERVREAARALAPTPAPPRQPSLFEPPARPPAASQARASAKPPARTTPPPPPSARTTGEKEAEKTPGAFTRLVVHTDGAARGNPGPAGAGAVLSRPNGEILTRVGRFLGTQTNNVAEYEGVILGLGRALELGCREVDLKADSLLVINQLKGEWKVKHEGLKPYYEKARALLRRFDRASLVHVRRELNQDADEMSNRAIDERL